ncbi:MAG: hypothetical protein U0R80_06465 [Nocardioidaceae bacterium]
MSTMSHRSAGRARRSPLRLAWWSLALFPVSFVLAFVVGEGVPALLGHPDPSLHATPGWVIAAAVVPAVLVFAAPFVVTQVLTRRAAAAGEPNARQPLVVAAVVVGAFVAANLGGLLVQLLD